MSKAEAERIADGNVRCFTLFRVFFTARFYYPVYALLFLDFGLTLEQFGILNGIWAVTIVLSEVPSGALGDTIGRRTLLIVAGICMVVEMGVLLFAPIGGGALLFWLFAVNRIVSGLAEAAASGADEAITFDALQAADRAGEWGRVLERVQRDTSLAFFVAMLTGAAVYDPQLMRTAFEWFGIDATIRQEDLVKLPIALTLISGIVVLLTALRFREPPKAKEGAVLETLRRSWRQTFSAARWIWLTPLPFGIILAVMALDNVIRQFLTLASEYWKVIELPIASYGVIGSGMALLGLFVPRIAREMAERRSPLRNFVATFLCVFLGLLGLGFAIPYWGILPAVLIYVGMGLTNYFVSRYMNEAAPSEQRATVLSFRGLSTNVAYGTVSLLYSALIAGIKLGADRDDYSSDQAYQEAVFVDSLAWFPWYFLVAVGLVFLLQWLRFGGLKRGNEG